MNLKSFKSNLLHGLIVMNFAGDPFLQLKEEKTKPKLKENLSLKSDTYIRTNLNDYVVLKINENYQVTVLPDSILTVDGIRNQDEFNIRSLYIRRGQIHIQEIQDPVKASIQLPEKKTKSKVKVVEVSSADHTTTSKTKADESEINLFEPIKIESDFFSFTTQKDQKLSLLVDSNLKDAQLKVCNFSSDFKLELFDHEIDQNLKANEGIQFNGQLDKPGQIAFDKLLEKRKIPKGKWASKEICLSDQIKKIQIQVVDFNIKKVQDAEKTRLQKIADKKRNDLRFLCHEPYGQLDQCHFIMKQNKCLRTRCNAEGKWTDQTEIGIAKNLCSLTGEVKSCGY